MGKRMLEENRGTKDEFHEKVSGILDTIKKGLAITGSIIGILLFAREIAHKAGELLANSNLVQDAVLNENSGENAGEDPVNVDSEVQVNWADYIINCISYLGKPVPDVFRRINLISYEFEDRNIKGGIVLTAEDKMVLLSSMISYHHSIQEANLWTSPFFNVFEELGWRFDETSDTNTFVLYYKDGIYGCIFTPEGTAAGPIMTYVTFAENLDAFFKYGLLKYKPRE
jgi:hypothetical protein